jgi:hypothetical protein
VRFGHAAKEREPRMLLECDVLFQCMYVYGIHMLVVHLTEGMFSRRQIPQSAGFKQ